MNILDIIAKKRDKKELTKDEIEFFIKGYVDGEITDYQAAALVMAIYINGMNEREITDLTLAMCYSGDVLDLSDLGEVVDKHSTGGVGDKITLILMPIVASLGIPPVAKMSGRGLGFTGGTIDKLESIPGYTTGLDIDTFKNNVKKIGISLIGQTLNLAPADKKLYALRDTISCTESIPLIASSIMSKKIASGANKIVIDVTCGSGAFMKNREQAEKLASVMTKIGDLANRETVCVITNMDEPVGYAVGNEEVIEAVDILKNKYLPKDIEHIITTLGANMLILAKKAETLEQGREMILENLHNGKGYEKFVQLVDNQGGDVSYIENTDKFEKAKYIEKIAAKKSGKITKLDALQIGKLSSYLGAGRMKKEDKINPRVHVLALCLLKKLGTK